jgi:pseudouridine-5'-phosphate glycosidase
MEDLPKNIFSFSKEVEEARIAGKAIVALESTIIVYSYNSIQYLQARVMASHILQTFA